MSQHVRNQHYVPQFLLRNFSSQNDDFIWTYDRNEKLPIKERIKYRAIKHVASENFFYDIIKGCKTGSHEYTLKEVEDKAAPIITEITKTKKINDLSKEYRETLSLFITLQILRTKRQLDQNVQMTESLYEQLNQEWKIKTEKFDPREGWLSMLDNAPTFQKAVMNKVWMLCESNNSFYISDHPVTLQNITFENSLRGYLGIDSPGIEIYLPLSPSLTLCLFCEKLFKVGGYHKDYINNVTNNIDCVRNINFLQIAYSQRFIFSHNNNFKLAKEILNKTQ